MEDKTYDRDGPFLTSHSVSPDGVLAELLNLVQKNTGSVKPITDVQNCDIPCGSSTNRTEKRPLTPQISARISEQIPSAINQASHVAGFVVSGTV